MFEKSHVWNNKDINKDIQRAADKKKLKKTQKNLSEEDFEMEDADVVTGGLQELADPIADYVHQLSGEHKLFVDFLDASVLKRLDTLKGEIKAKNKLYLTSVKDSYKDVVTQRTRTVETISLHKSASVKNSKHTTTDPWMLERVLDNQLREMIQEENSFEKRLSHVIDDMIVFDRMICTSIQKVWEDYISERAKSYQNRMTIDATALAPLFAFSASDAFAGYLAKHQIETAPAVRDLSDFPYLPSEQGVLKEGIVYRQGTVRKTSFKDCVLVLTNTGYLHLFDAEHNLVKKSAKAAAEGNAMKLSSVYDGLQKPKARWSIPLRNPRVKIVLASAPGSDFKNCLEIAVHGPTSAKHGMFKNGKDQTFKVTTFLLKVSDEEDLLSWFTSITEKLAESVPEAAPEPLFSAAESISRKNTEQKDSGFNVADTGFSSASSLSPASPVNSEAESSKALPHVGSEAGKAAAIRAVGNAPKTSALHATLVDNTATSA